MGVDFEIWRQHILKDLVGDCTRSHQSISDGLDIVLTIPRQLILEDLDVDSTTARHPISEGHWLDFTNPRQLIAEDPGIDFTISPLPFEKVSELKTSTKKTNTNNQRKKPTLKPNTTYFRRSRACLVLESHLLHDY